MVDLHIPIIFGLIAPLFWLGFFLFEDRDHPEPKWMVAIVFLGGVLAAFLALSPEILLNAQFPQTGFPYQNKLLIPFAFIEEFSKFAIVFLIIKYSKYFDEKVDAMIYMIAAALGFAAIENIFTLFNILEFHVVLETTIIRGIGSTLLHALASGILAFHWMRHQPIVGLINATLLHATFNFLILRIEGDAKIYATLILVVAALFLFRDFEIIKRPLRALARKD
ncbi:PrsW family intramembrane metalloprotease [Patescibacteria group bacterium]|nr:PrsW family intramembrane metalloprotease [Patescibacteria group bacterium]